MKKNAIACIDMDIGRYKYTSTKYFILEYDKYFIENVIDKTRNFKYANKKITEAYDKVILFDSSFKEHKILHDYIINNKYAVYNSIYPNSILNFIFLKIMNRI